MRNHTSLPLPARSGRPCGHALPILAVIATLVVVVQAAPAQQILADWEADMCPVGVWTDNCWGAEPMPNNGHMGFTYVALISDGNATVTQNIDITLDGLIIVGGGAINVMIMPNGRRLTIVAFDGGPTGFITIDDRLLMQSTGSATSLIASGPAGSTLTIDAEIAGEIQMSDNFQNRISGANGNETILFGPRLTVGGSGQIGMNLTTLINEGTIVADLSTTLDVDPNADGMTNSGLMVARDGGLLQFLPGVFDNALGEIRAEDASTVRFLAGAEITGGLMVAKSGGVLDFNGGTLVGPTVRIDVGGVGQVTFTSTVENLTNDGVVTHSNSRSLNTAGQFNNTGSYFMNSAGQPTTLIVVGDTVLDGGGTINMSDNFQNRIRGIKGTETLTNVDNTIRGSGQIGMGLTTLINEGTIVADQSTMLDVDPGAGGMTNTGLMAARDGGVLQILPGVYDNALGEIRAEDASTVRFLAGAEISGGLMVAESGGLLDFNGGTLLGPTVRIETDGFGQVTFNSTVENLTNDGVISHNNNWSLTTAGQFNNTGSYFMDSDGQSTTLIFVSDTVLDGGGTINMSDNLQNRVRGITGTETFTNVDNTIRGSGQIGFNTMMIINQGTIVADQSTKLDIDPSSGGMTNSGLMVARDGGLLQLQPGVYDNALGEIRAEDASTVHFLTGSEITGGLMVAKSGGVFDFNGGTLVGPTVRIDVGGVGQVTFNSTVENLTNDGVITHNDRSALNTAGQFNNTGNYFMNSAGQATSLIFVGDTMLDGGGTINMSDNLQNQIRALAGTEMFTNVDNTIRGSGQIGINTMTIINQGTIVADQVARLDLDPSAGGLDNQGTLTAENGAELRLQAGPFTTSGSVFAAAGSTITRVASDYIQTAGSTIIDGSLVLNAGGTVTLDGGVLGGDGLVSAHVNNVAGAASPGNSAGTLTVDGDYTQGIDGDFTVELAGTKPGQFDVLVVNDDATLAGSISVSVLDGFVPTVGDSFTVLSSPNMIFGSFDTVNEVNLPGGLDVDVIHNDNDVTLLIVVATCPADLDGSGAVDFGDILAILSAWGNAGGPEDLDGSGKVDFEDILVVLAAWGPCP